MIFLNINDWALLIFYLFWALVIATVYYYFIRPFVNYIHRKLHEDEKKEQQKDDEKNS